jgi:hypothetical protein
MHGANVVSWKRPDGSDVLHLRPDSPMDGVQPILCARSLPPPAWASLDDGHALAVHVPQWDQLPGLFCATVGLLFLMPRSVLSQDMRSFQKVL